MNDFFKDLANNAVYDVIKYLFFAVFPFLLFAPHRIWETLHKVLKRSKDNVSRLFIVSKETYKDYLVIGLKINIESNRDYNRLVCNFPMYQVTRKIRKDASWSRLYPHQPDEYFIDFIIGQKLGQEIMITNLPLYQGKEITIAIRQIPTHSEITFSLKGKLLVPAQTITLIS